MQHRFFQIPRAAFQNLAFFERRLRKDHAAFLRLGRPIDRTCSPHFRDGGIASLCEGAGQQTIKDR
jgi:hypothetical protein